MKAGSPQGNVEILIAEGQSDTSRAPEINPQNQELATAQDALRDPNEHLESKVAQRTAALEVQIEERTQAQQALQSQFARLGLLHRITRAISERQDLHSIFQVVVRSLEDDLPIDFGCVLLHDPATQMLEVCNVGVKSGALAVKGADNEIRDALTNLIFSAVDAMPEGGKLSIRTYMPTGEQAHGQSLTEVVHLEVSETGTGMDEETKRRCVEPFFTTKEERGSGLGLAQVYGRAQPLTWSSQNWACPMSTDAKWPKRSRLLPRARRSFCSRAGGMHLTEQNEMPLHVDRILSKPPKLHDLRAMLAEFSHPGGPPS